MRLEQSHIRWMDLRNGQTRQTTNLQGHTSQKDGDKTLADHRNEFEEVPMKNELMVESTRILGAGTEWTLLLGNGDGLYHVMFFFLPVDDSKLSRLRLQADRKN